MYVALPPTYPSMNTKLKAFFARTAIAIALIPQAEAQNTNHTPGYVISWGDQVIPNVAPGTRFIKIAAGGNHSLALESDRTVVAWGLNDFGQSSVPGGLNGVVAIAAGFSHSLARKSDGTVMVWGSNEFDQSIPPGGLNGVVAIAAGGFHSLALIDTAPQPFTLSAPQRMPDGSFRWMLSGEAGRNYTVESSTNVTLWTDLQTVTLGGSSVQITDTNASAYARRFYRVRTQ